MDNKTISRSLTLLSQLMELHSGNPFKIKSLAAAAFKISRLPYSIATKSIPEMEKIDGLGKSTAVKIAELVNTNSLQEMEVLLQETPAGIVEMLGVKGIGPKKILVIWKELGIESLGELLYACNENRLIEAKGFGAKTQEEMKKAIEFNMASSGRFLYASVETFAESLLDQLKTTWSSEHITLVDNFRRKGEVLDHLHFLIGLELNDGITAQLEKLGFVIIKKDLANLETKISNGIKAYFTFCKSEEYSWHLFKYTGNDEHVSAVINRLGGDLKQASSEFEIYAKAGLQYIEPELREGLNEIELAAENAIPALIKLSDLKGTLHNHSTWSDGVHTLEEMTLFCRDNLKLEYLGISDHSKAAFYANGLKEDQIMAQHAEIDRLNKKLAPFKILKGIESDILFDGSLDYSNDILSTFDFVVASVHSTLKMTEEKATSRLIKAIENPYTTILGHPTGRMLLARSGYPINHKKIIDACAANHVVIEINSNPLRLDMDWRWHQYAIEKGVILTINPDAHRNDSFYHMHYGVLVARKGCVSSKSCLNTYSLTEIETYFNKRKLGVRIETKEA